jgi:hypothetical protein
MAFDPILIVVILLVGLGLPFLVLAATRRAGKVNPKPRFSRAKVTIFVGLGLFVLAPIASFFLRFFVPGWVFSVLTVVGLLLVVLSLASLIADLAEHKGRSWAAFFWLSVVLGPLIMSIVAASVSPFPDSPGYVSPRVALDGPDAADQIKKLSDLQKEGIITKAEFAAKKKDLLDRM